MQKIIKFLNKDDISIRGACIVGLCGFFLLNMFAVFEYGKYFFGLDNIFLEVIPAIRILAKIDFLFVLLIILILNKKEGYFSFKELLSIVMLFSTGGVLYYLIKEKPLTIIILLGLYGIGISIFACIVGLGAVFPISLPSFFQIKKFKKASN
ncbi:hypothetical protein [Alkaliphilus peptidifermentans]|uniref:Uncharacterized protein n=1 Tax=Alkaliphilus peptidifermentans DSM 18978 TaxID=1120976 RepID=A0A1G5CY82_9FIRM|nr:hypothetical protein [Alkaliphilus peptidifermentans]SCY07237.1 hypothetical protein SAMN03080606_00804 [Alkaliphilus peptidifermentans DSM 18978]